jgi:hypothetical protein
LTFACIFDELLNKALDYHVVVSQSTALHDHSVLNPLRFFLECLDLGLLFVALDLVKVLAIVHAFVLVAQLFDRGHHLQREMTCHEDCLCQKVFRLVTQGVLGDGR